MLFAGRSCYSSGSAEEKREGVGSFKLVGNAMRLRHPLTWYRLSCGVRTDVSEDQDSLSSSKAP